MQRLHVLVRHLAARPLTQSVRGARMLSTQPAAAAAKDESEPAPVRITPHPNGCLTLSLHRPKALNALNLPMVRLLTQGLRSVRREAGAPGSKCVLVYGEGEKAFCAGGDIRALAFPDHPRDPSNFFREEYALNALVASTPTPYVSILRGITMGGGVGISVHGSVRVCTENTMFAMPETGIGLFPDVGGTYFLPRLPGSIGMYLALTGQALGAADSIYAGVGTHFIPQASLPAFISEMESSKDSVDSLLAKYTAPVPADKPDAKLKSFLPARRELIDRVFSAPTYPEVLARLEAASVDQQLDESARSWSAGVLKQLGTKSPTSLLITFHAMSSTGPAARSLPDALATELRLGSRITAEGAGGDFAEGVKAVLIDKKHKPQWRPMPTMEEVKAKYFAPFTKEEGIEELNLQ